MINRLLQVQYVSVHLPAAAQLGAPARRALRPDAGEPGAQSTRKVSHTGALRNTRAFRNVISTGYENLDGTPDLQELRTPRPGAGPATGLVGYELAKGR